MNHSFEEYSILKNALNIEEPWDIINSKFCKKEKELHIYLDFKKGSKFKCSYCHEFSQVHDIVDADRTWRHLNFWEHKTIIHARIPRTKCINCNRVLTINVGWSRPRSRFTRLFEYEVKELMKDMPVAAVARKVKEHDTRLWRIFHL